MKVKMGRSLKFDGEFYYFELESSEVPNLESAQSVKQTLEKVLQGWINEVNPKFKPSNGEIGNHVEKPKAHSGFCIHCGKKINPKYIQCYDCWKKHQQS